MFLIAATIRGHSKITWTEFCFFSTPHPCVDSFYTLSMDKNRHFLNLLPPPCLILSTYLLNGPLYISSRYVFIIIMKSKKKAYLKKHHGKRIAKNQILFSYRITAQKLKSFFKKYLSSLKSFFILCSFN